MPELPEVQTTVTCLKKDLVGLSIKDVWSSYDSLYYKDKKNIKDKNYYKSFKKNILNKTILNVERKGKYVLIHLSDNTTILTHMKMTGHFLYGKYKKVSNKKRRDEKWIAVEKGPLKDDPFNRFIRLVFNLSNNNHLVLSDARKFATVFVYLTDNPPKNLVDLGSDPLQKTFTFKNFLDCLPQLSTKPIKQVLLDQKVISGIGNIYSDEILWESGVHPKSYVGAIPRHNLYKIYSSMKTILRQGINLKGDSMSDYRTPTGEKGFYHYYHNVYGKKGDPCSLRGCKGKIERMVIAGRSTHFCNQHQKRHVRKKRI